MRTRRVVSPSLLAAALAGTVVAGPVLAGPARAAGPTLGPPVSVTDLVPVPRQPRSYRGPRRLTAALDRSFAGTAAIRVTRLPAGAVLEPGQAVALSDAAVFAVDSPVLTVGARRDIAILASYLSGARRVRCEGFTDYAGLRTHELALARSRARNVCSALVARSPGVSAQSVGYGPARPAEIGGTPRSRTQNRRVVVVVTR